MSVSGIKETPEMDVTVRPIRWRLLGVLILVLTMLISGFSYTFLSQHKKTMALMSEQTLENCSRDLQAALKKQAYALESLQEILILLRDDDLYDALKARDAETLFEKYELVFAQLNDHDSVTHFYFQDSTRTNLVRIHNRPKSGDLINRFTTLEAERTGRTSWGIELGPLGTFTLRVVRPLFEGETLVGYLELGKEIEDILSDIAEVNGVEMAAVIQKSALTRSKWESGMAMLGREGDWDRYPGKVLIYSSLDPLPSEYAGWVSEEECEYGVSGTEVNVSGAAWRVLVSPLMDSSGTAVGDLIAMLDVTAEKEAFRRELFWVSGLTTLLLFGLVGFLYILLKRTDERILRQAEDVLGLNQRLARNETKFRTLYESSNDAFFLLGDLGFLDCNPATLPLFGCQTKEEFCSRHPVDFSPEFQPDGTPSSILAERRIKTAIETGSNRFEWLHQRLDETTFYADVLLNCMELDGKPVVQAVVRDISPRKARELERQRLTKQLEAQTAVAKELAAEAQEATIAKSSFLANMSHEIRTPMNAVIGMCDLLMETQMTAEQQDFASTIHLSGNALLVLINDILDFSKIEAGELVLEQCDFDLTRCLEGTMDFISSKAAEKGLELLVEFGGSVPAVVCGDEARLRQILLNLLSNAVKFTQAGEICVSTDSEPIAEGQKLTVSVRDTGIGVAPENLEKIFGQFSQADESTTRQFGGTGLGLTISRRLSELMGGEMWVESTLGEGTTFYFTVQVRSAKRSKIVLATHKPFEPQNKKVLVVDDNKTNVRILDAQLKRWGLEPVPFMKPEEALASVQNGDIYCLMITDMQMPDMDGSMLVHEIRKIRPAYELPVIMLTSIGQEKPNVSLDIAAVLSKPTKSTQLHQHIDNVLHGTSTARDARGLEPVDIAEACASKILLVEDNPTNQKVAMLMLKKLGYTADLASDGLEALEKTEATAYDIVLMDIQMPNMDGLTATKEIKKRLEGKPAPKIIGMTAHAADEERERGLAAGMDEYLTKPIQLLKLKEMLLKSRS